KELLLVLDNCEHLLAPAMLLTGTLLRSCPALRVLATSREPLGLPGEAVFRVPTLSVPAQPAGAVSLVLLDRLSRYDAVRLFVERAQAAQPRFGLSAANAGAVVQVCRQLDGIPLALELAAARIKVLAIEQVAARLADRFRLVAGGSADVPRQQTL